MRKTRTNKAKAVDRWLTEIRSQFPWLTSEVWFESVPGGGDVLIRSEVPVEHSDEFSDVLHASSHISGLIGEDTGVFIVNMTIPPALREEEALPHG